MSKSKSKSEDKVETVPIPKPWTQDEEIMLYSMREDGLPYRIISSELLCRSVNSCEKKYRSTIWVNKPFYDNAKHTIKEGLKKAYVERLANLTDKRISVNQVKADIIGDRLVRAIEALPNVPKPRKSKRKKFKKDHVEDVGLIISDCHIGEEFTLEETGGLGEYNLNIFKQRVDNLTYGATDIVDLHSHIYTLKTLHLFCLGDIVAGMNDVGAWSPIYINMPIFEQFVEGVEALAQMIDHWLTIFEDINFYGVFGNHGRCQDKNTKILTPDGYKTYDQIKKGDLVGTINMTNARFEFQPIQKVHIYQNEPNLVVGKTASAEIKQTLDHDVLVDRMRPKKNCVVNLHKVKAKSLVRDTGTIHKIPISTYSGNIDYNISDDMLRLLGIIMTDGCYPQKCNSITIYQSKIKNISKIKKLLGRIGCSHSIYKREKNVDSILGVELKQCRTENCFYIKSSDLTRKIRKELLPIRESVPNWMHSLSDRQVNILLEYIVLGDGSVRKEKKHKDGYVRRGGLDVVWGKKNFLEALAGLLVSHNIPCSLNKHKRIKTNKQTENQENWYLQVKKRACYCIKSNQFNVVDYNDTVWCVTVDNGTIAVLGEQGDAYFTGNCSKRGSEKEYVNWDFMTYQFLMCRFKNNPRVKFNVPKTWWIFEKIRSHKFLIVHGDDMKGMAWPAKSLLDFEQKMIGILKDIPDYTIAGHYHSAAELSTNHGKVLLNGSFIGGDIYSLKNLQRSSLPEQKIFGIHDRRGITWTYDLNLNIERR